MPGPPAKLIRGVKKLPGNLRKLMLPLFPEARHQRRCPEISGRDWMIPGNVRSIEAEPSRRAFLLKSGTLFTAAPLRSSFFEALACKRRSRLTKEFNEALAKSMSRLLPEPFSAFPQLAPFDLYAGDGHFHSAAIHDPRDADGTRHATGHVYLLNLRSQAMRQLVAQEVRPLVKGRTQLFQKYEINHKEYTKR